MRREFLAHSKNDVGETEPLRVHLSRVSDRAAKYAEALGAAEEARFAGLLHDVGKYGDLFQRRLRGEASGVDHWSPGAWISLIRYREHGIAAAAAIQGHHIGLQSISKQSLGELHPLNLVDNHPLNMRLSESDPDVLLRRLGEDGVYLADPSRITASLYRQDELPAARMMDVRMLYSTLVDADFVETEAFFQEKEIGKPGYRSEGKVLEPARLLESLEAYIANLARGSLASSAVNGLRRDLLSECLKAGLSPRGTFTLTAPTGSGKTLSLLAFALRHALKHDLRRIIVVIPYLSIIEQTAASYRLALGAAGDTEDIVLENHSLAGIRGNVATQDLTTRQQRVQLLSENWDAPIIITTSVQFLESLFSNRSSACRKLHRIAGSIVLFDEVQTLPTRLAIPTLATLSHIVDRYGCSVVFSTATQPAFKHIESEVRKYAAGGWTPREIAPPELRLFERSPRTHCVWPDSESRLGWDELADLMINDDCRQVLCIVNLKRHALEVFRRLKESGAEGLFHLSTSMCPSHRQKVLEDCLCRLAGGQPCRLISTQCIEAGVDIDFPVVMRALGPLDSMAQAAGRCNRNGNISAGRFHIFNPDDADRRLYPDNAYAQAASVTRIFLAQHGREGMDISNPGLFTEYYKELYSLSELSTSNQKLQNAIRIGDFEEVARDYRLIAQNTINVLVPYDVREFDRLVALSKDRIINRDWIVQARPHCISVFAPRDDDPIVPHLDPAGKLPENRRSHEWFVLLDPDREFYSMDMGLIPFDDTAVLIG